VQDAYAKVKIRLLYQTLGAEIEDVLDAAFEPFSKQIVDALLCGVQALLDEVADVFDRLEKFHWRSF